MKTINELKEMRTLAMVTENWNEYRATKNELEKGKMPERFLVAELRKTTGEKVGEVIEIKLSEKKKHHVIHEVKLNGSRELKNKLFKYLRENNR